MDAINYRLEVFEGPLDLLLSLIQKNKMSIDNIQIGIICEQYLEYIEAAQNLDQLRNVVGMKPRRRLVENVDGLSRCTLGQLRGKLDALCLTARERGRGLTELQIPKTDVEEGLELARDHRNAVEEMKRLLD